MVKLITTMAISAVVKYASPMESIFMGKPLMERGLELKIKRMTATPAVAKPSDDKNVVALVAPMFRSRRYRKASMET